MKKTLLSVLWRTMLLTGAAALAWNIVKVNMADYFIESASKGDAQALDLAIQWDASHPRAQALYGARLLESGNEKEAEGYLVSAIEANPADARPLMLLAEMRRRSGQENIGDQMVETADRLMPVDAAVQRLIAAYWYERGQLDRVVQHLSITLSADASYSKALFPIFLEIAENPGTRQLFKPLTDKPPVWWEGFAFYVTRNAKNIDTLRTLARMRSQSDSVVISVRARNAYIDRLKKEGFLSEAYLLWVRGLDSDQRQLLGYLYNGDFEQEFSQSGFGWYAGVPKNKGIVISTAKTYGIEGKQALYVSFSGKRFKFNHLKQSLFLSPGKYRFSGRVRVDQLRARKGLQWVASCTEGSGGVLGESARFLGKADWRSFDFEINVPRECKGQTLRLQSVGSREVDHELAGDVWFDDLRIRLQRSLSESG